jgi:hypothetical protein
VLRKRNASKLRRRPLVAKARANTHREITLVFRAAGEVEAEPALESEQAERRA